MRGAAQIEIAVAQPHVLVDLVIVRRPNGGVSERLRISSALDRHFDLAGREASAFSVPGRAQPDAAAHAMTSSLRSVSASRTNAASWRWTDRRRAA
jgi:hypothetical protein